jgi:hypothetical protein
MSEIFRPLINPPLNTDWKVWLNEEYNITDKEISRMKMAVLIIGRSYAVTDDIWNIIVFYVFNNELSSICTSKLWNDDLLKWLEYWVCNKQQHIRNPMRTIKSSFELSNPIYYKKNYGEKQSLLMTKKPLVESLDNELDFWVEMPHVGTTCIGFAFPNDFDITNVKECRIALQGAPLRDPYYFIDEYSGIITDNLDDNREYKFWICPTFKVIPMICLPFCRITIILKLSNKVKLNHLIFFGTIGPQTHLGDEYIINDKENRIIIHNGTAAQQ